MAALTFPTSRPVLTRWAYGLAGLTIAYNVVEGVVAIGFGAADESLALFGFGVDSFVEVGAAGLVLWRLAAAGGATDERASSREKLASRAIGALLLALAVGVAAGATVSLVVGAHPEQTLAGVVIAAASIALMLGLWRAKVGVADRLGSRTLRADAACTLACLQLSVVLLAGSAIYTLAPALWWVDSAAALALSALIAREGLGTVRASFVAEASGCGCEH